MQDQIPATPETPVDPTAAAATLDPNAAAAVLDPNAAAAALDPNAVAQLTVGQESLDVSSALLPGMDRLDLLMGNTDSLALSKMGFAHLIENADAVGIVAGTALGIMSILVWFYILYNALRLVSVRRRYQSVMDAFWEAKSPRDAIEQLKDQPEYEPFSKLALDAAFAAEHHSDALGGRMAEALSRHEFIDRALRSGVQREAGKMESGLTMLASVGSTAPFVGLFGTVWGIYHALIRIGASGEATLDVVAGPVGEALIMTCVGLGVAIPSVLAYNYFVRSNKELYARFATFAHDLLDYFATGNRVRGQRYGTKQHMPSQG
jgi:biopolymer transport protein ExbB